MIKISISILMLLAFNNLLAQTNDAGRIDGKPLTIGTAVDMYSKELREKRTLNIHLPEGYSKTDTTKYPVIYLLDGSINEDFIHVVGLVQFYSFEWVNRLSKSIVVGIASVDRRRDFTFPTTFLKDRQKYPTTGHSHSFIAFIEKELQPFIDAKYKTTRSKTIIGQSFGGLLATEILLKRPLLFSKYIIVSPSLWWNNGSLLNLQSDLLSANFTQKTQVYIGVGKEGLAPFEVPRMMEADADSLYKKIKLAKSNRVKVFYDYLPSENHATIMHQAVANAIKLFFEKQ